MFENQLIATPLGWYILPILIWTMIWKGLALWKAGNNKQSIWFIVMFITSTVGIIPIIYLLWFQKKTFAETEKIATPIIIKKVVKRKPAKKTAKRKPIKKAVKKKPMKRKAVKKKTMKKKAKRR